jgi:beta-glucosidase
MYVTAMDQASGYRELPMNVSHPKMFSSWHTLSPEVMYWAAKQLQSIWNPEEIFITKNGYGADALCQLGCAMSTARGSFPGGPRKVESH